jgi:hypothetical protein
MEACECGGARSEKGEQQTDGDSQDESAADLGPSVSDEFLETLVVDRTRLAQFVEEGVEGARVAADILAQTSSLGNEIETEDEADAEERAPNA